jgi:uncharacterized protein YukE
MSDPSELRERARQLNNLADDVAALLDDAKGYVRDTMTTWAGPNREEVSGALSSWQTQCGTVAEELRSLATSCENDAQDIEDQEGEDDE